MGGAGGRLNAFVHSDAIQDLHANAFGAFSFSTVG